MVGLVAVVLIAHDLPLSSYLRRLERDRLTTSIERDAFTIAGRVSPVIAEATPNDAASIDEVLSISARDAESTVVVIDEGGFLLSSSNVDDAAGEDYADRPEVATALLGEPASGSRFSATVGEELVYVSVPVLSGSSVLGVVRITYPKSILDSRVNEQRRSLLLAAGVSLAMAAFVALVFARQVSRPLEQLEHATNDLSGGNLDSVAPEVGPPETKRLALSFNAMARRLGGLIERQRRFAGDASHQMRTPLTALRLRLEQASEQIETDPAAAREHLDEAMNETERLSNLVEQLLRLARSEAAVLERNDVDLAAMVAGRVEEWRYLASEHGVTIQADEVSTIWVRTSALALREILDNYIDNALEVSPNGAAIRLMLVSEGTKVSVLVRDQGRGMTEEELRHAFDRFWRASVGSNRRSGSGLGLAIVAQLAEASGMSVELRHAPDGGIDAVVTMDVAPG
jgi:signal transduction histidine kinase